jgi:signal peptidase I
MMNDDPSMRDRARIDAGDSGPVGVAGGQAGGPGRSADARTGEPEPGSVGQAGDRSAAEVPVPGAGEVVPGPDDADGKSRKRRSFWRELPVLVVVALVIALLIKTFVVQAFFIPSSSMENTLEVYDKVLVNKLVYHFRNIQPGDVVVFSGAGSWDPVPPPARASSNPVVRLYDWTLGRLLHSISGLFGTVPGQTDYIKRVIGVPGDLVACCTAGGLVTVNGVPLHESSYLFPGAKPSLIHFRFKVPAGRLWVMGDNRYVSDDSRLHRQSPGSGTVPENKVIGRAFLIVWPPGRWGVLPIPSTFSQSGVHRRGAAAVPAGPGRSAGSAVPAVSAGSAAVALSQSPLLPLAAGFAGAVPLTWLSRRLRLRPRRWRQRHR